MIGNNMTINQLHKLILIAGILTLPSFGISAQTFDAQISFLNQAPQQVKIKENDFKINTIAGKINIEAEQIHRIENHPQIAGFLYVTLINGERWSVERGEIMKILFGTDYDTQTKLDLSSFTSLTSINAPTLSPNVGYRFLLKDGSQAYIDPSSISFDIRYNDRRYELPLGTLRALKFRLEPDGKPSAIIVRFATGQVFQFEIDNPSETINAITLLDHKIEFAYSDVVGVLPVPDIRVQRSGDARISLFRDGKPQIQGDPVFDVYDFRTKAGKVLLPVYYIKRIIQTDEFLYPYRVQTIFGDNFKARWRNDVVTLNTANSRDQQIPVSDIQALIANTNAMAVMDAYYFQDHNQDTLSVFIPSSTQWIDSNDREISVDEFLVIRQDDDDQFMITQSASRRMIAAPAESRIELVHSASGQSIEARWDDIRLATQTPPPQTNFQTARFDAPLPDENDDRQTGLMNSLTSILPRSSENNDNADNASNLRIRLPYGDFTINTTDVVKVWSWRDNSGLTLETSSGDLIQLDPGSFATRRDLRPLLDVTELPEEPTITTLGTPPSTTTINQGVQVMLRRGEIITGTIIENIPITPLISLRAVGSITNNLPDLIIRDPLTDQLIYHYQDRTIAAEIDDSEFFLQPFASTNRLKIELNQLEWMTSDTSPPPHTQPDKGWSPRQLDEVLIEAQSFMLGSDEGLPDELPQVNITLSDFYITASEITVAQFASFVESTGYETLAEIAQHSQTWKSPGFVQSPTHPVVMVSWYDAARFCNWRSKQTGLDEVYQFEDELTVTSDLMANGYRLPTEAEWELAAGKSLQRRYPWGNQESFATPQAYPANFSQGVAIQDGWPWTNPVKAYPTGANALFGMGGNVWEWCEDWYFDRAYSAFRNQDAINPVIATDDVAGLRQKVMRGGSFKNSLESLRVTSRGYGLPYAYAAHVGFRCVRRTE